MFFKILLATGILILIGGCGHLEGKGHSLKSSESFHLPNRISYIGVNFIDPKRQGYSEVLKHDVHKRSDSKILTKNKRQIERISAILSTLPDSEGERDGVGGLSL